MLYRPAVAAIVQDFEGRILIGERLNIAGAWQFPQGGIEPDESREQALAREVMEELSLPPGAYEVIEVKGPYSYEFPAGKTKRGFRGQAHHYFLLRLLAPAAAVSVASAHPEFRQVRWIEPSEFELDWLPPMKRAAYGRVFHDFFGVKLDTIAIDSQEAARHEAC